MDKLAEREDKLLGRETNIRRSRYVARALAIAAVFRFGFLIYTNQPSEHVSYHLVFMVLLTEHAHVCTIRLQHIETIKYYREQAAAVGSS